MEKIGCVKCAIWMVITVLLSLLVDNVIAQQGFTSIDCGAKTDYTGENNITWVTDHKFIDTGKTEDIGNATFPSYLQRVRFFPKPLNKSCYNLPVETDATYLLRLWFFVGNYSRFSGSYASFTHTINTPGMSIATPVTTEDVNNPYIHEGIYFSSGTVLSICLIKTSDTDDPFINAIELRRLGDGMYNELAKPGTMLLLQARENVGGDSTVIIRYPQDKFDRIWRSYMTVFNSSIVRNVSSQDTISPDNTKNFPPTAVMQTAWVMNKDDIIFGISTSYWAKSLLVLYFAEIDTLDVSESRSFSFRINWEEPSDIITLVRDHSALERTFISNEQDFSIFRLVKWHNSYSRPILNAFEYYTIHHNNFLATSSQDTKALNAIKSRYDIKEWSNRKSHCTFGQSDDSLANSTASYCSNASDQKKDWIYDPCSSIRGKGLRCVNSSLMVNRISEIDLSRRNLTGPVAEEIGQLTALINVSLDNNQLTGPLPNFSNLTMLETLHLQNNNFSGSLPDWLLKLKNLKELSLDHNQLTGPLPNFSNLKMLEKLHLQNNNLSGSLPDWLLELTNLKELFIMDNNFSGEIQQFDNKTSLNFKSSGNKYLCLKYTAGECIKENQKNSNNSKNVFLGISISGCSVIALALMVGIAVYWRKLREIRNRNKDSAMILSKVTKSRAFTSKEMMEATENFSRRVGEGGSGSVFSGKLGEEEDIAVKLLPSLQQFLHEVEVHSRAEHENLMSLLGYCFEPKNYMLIYKYMSEGSLWHNLHGEGHSNLNWKTRLKIALHIAQGLEFLHGCNPKIIHMDIKTANILLDSNMNAKLADFGISRVTSDGEASHATMVTAKGTPGYIDPEYSRTHKVTEKSDVYSFGVVLFEIISGKSVTNANHVKEFNLVEWVRPHVGFEEIGAEIIDEKLARKYNIKSIFRVAKVALKCVSDDPYWRPSISDVVGEIKEAIIDENENNAQIPFSEEIGIEYGDLQGGPVRSPRDTSQPKRYGMG